LIAERQVKNIHSVMFALSMWKHDEIDVLEKRCRLSTVLACKAEG